MKHNIPARPAATMVWPLFIILLLIMHVQQNFSLQKYNTFGIDVTAKYFSVFSSVEDLAMLLADHPTASPPLILGGGSNILFTKNYDGLVLKNEIRGIKTVHEDDDHIYVKAGAGENWHAFVMHCIKNNFAGVENLSLIPGNTGASPMQNIGAYGVEIRDVFHSLEAWHIKEKRLVNFSLHDCEFGYRESIFKKKYKDEFVVISITCRLDKHPEYKISYGAIQEELDKMNVAKLNIQAISRAVINIRSSKLPDPAVLGNAGSFFKNPEVTLQIFREMENIYDGIPGFILKNGNVKLAAGWLIEQCGWKGYRRGDAGCHAKQALVLVNFGNASGKQMYDLAGEIRQSVKEKFDVLLETEVNII